MTDDSERPIPPQPWPGCVVLVATVRGRWRPTQYDWLILSSTLLLSLHCVPSELPCSPSPSLSARLQSHRIPPSFLKESSQPTVHHLLRVTFHPLQSHRPLLLQRHVQFVVSHDKTAASSTQIRLMYQQKILFCDSACHNNHVIVYYINSITFIERDKNHCVNMLVCGHKHER